MCKLIYVCQILDTFNIVCFSSPLNAMDLPYVLVFRYLVTLRMTNAFVVCVGKEI